MMRIGSCALLALLLGLTACRDANIAVNPAFTVSEISAAEFPYFSGGQAVYFYNSPTVDPETLLLEMLHAGLPVVRAWLPLDNRCMDIVGARFTVELSATDQRIEKFGFSKGQGRLECATKLMRYVITG